MRPLRALYTLSRRATGAVLVAALALGLAAAADLTTLPVDSTFRSLLPENDPLLERVQRYERQLQEEVNRDAVLLRLRSPQDVSREDGVRRLLNAGQRVQQALQPHDIIVEASYKRDRPDLLNVDPLALDRQTLQQLKAKIAELRQAVGSDTLLPSTDEQTLAERYSQLARTLEELMRGLGVFQPGKLGETIRQIADREEELRQLNARVRKGLDQLPDRLDALASAVDRMQRELDAIKSGIAGGASEISPYYLSRNRDALVVQVRPDQPAAQSLAYNRRVVSILKTELSRLNLQEQGIEWRLKGPHIFAVQSDEVLHRDMNRTATLAGIGVLALFMLVLRRLVYPVMATLPILLALLGTLVITKHVFGGLNLLTAFLPAIVLGLGIDYGIQFISHYLELRQGSRRVLPALRATLTTKGLAMIVAASATSLVLLTVGIVSQTTGLAEMGFVLGIGVLLSCVLTLSVLPALIVLGQRLVGRRQRARPPRPWDLSGWARRVTQHRWPIIVLVGVSTAAMAVPASRTDFTFVSEDVSPTDLPSQQVAAYIDEHFATNDWIAEPENYFFFFVQPSLDRVREVSNALYQLESVNQRPLSYYSFLPFDTPEERKRLQDRLAELRSLDPVSPLQQAADRLATLHDVFDEPEPLVAALGKLESQLTRSEEEIIRRTGDRELAERFATLAEQTATIRQRFQELAEADTAERLFALRDRIRTLIDDIESLQSALPSPERIEDLIANPPDRAKELFFADDGRAIVAVRVSERTIWNSDRYNRFLNQASQIHDDFFGVPQTRSRLESYMRRDFAVSTAAAVVIITLVLGVSLRRSRVRRGTGLSIVTLALGYLWMLGALELLGIDFNVANILISPLLIGLGVDNCVYLLARLRDLGSEDVSGATASTALPILANTLATMIGFGSLMLADTPILRVLGESAVLGIGFMTLFGLTFLPAALAVRR